MPRNGERLIADETRDGPAGKNFVAYLPIGPILAVMPWNFPYWQCLRFAAPAIMAGNVGLLKHASNVSQCALEIEKVLLAAGAPQGVFQTLIVSSKKVEGILKDSRLRAATLTGSEGAGSAVAATSGAEIKRDGAGAWAGPDPFIVMPSADIAKAVSTGVTARMQNNGQSCNRGQALPESMPTSTTISSAATPRPSRRSRSAIRSMTPPGWGRSP